MTPSPRPPGSSSYSSYSSRRYRSRVYRRRRIVAAGSAVLVVVVLVALVNAVIGGGGGAGARGSAAATARRRSGHSAAPVPVPAAVQLVSAFAPFTLSAPLSRMVVLPDGRGLAVAGGLDAADISVSAVSYLSPRTGAEVTAGALPTALHDAAGVAIGGHALIAGGGQSASFTTIESFRLADAVASAVGTASVVGQLPVPRSDLSAAAVGGVGYLLGGWNGSLELKTVERLLTSGLVQPAGRLAVGVRYAAVAVFGHRIWLLGGQIGNSPTSTVQVFDPVTGRTHLAGALPVPLEGASAFTLAGSLFVAGGETPAGVTDAIYRLDPATGAWSRAGVLARAVAFAGSGEIGSTVYLLGGETPAAVQTIQTVRVAPGAGSG